MCWENNDNKFLHTFFIRQILNSLEKVEFIGKILTLFEEKPEWL